MFWHIVREVHFVNLGLDTGCPYLESSLLSWAPSGKILGSTSAGPQLVPSKSFRIHHSSINHPLDAIPCLLKVTLNNSYVQRRRLTSLQNWHPEISSVCLALRDLLIASTISTWPSVSHKSSSAYAYTAQWYQTMSLTYKSHYSLLHSFLLLPPSISSLPLFISISLHLWLFQICSSLWQQHLRI
jgi:hypothetical protein